MRKKNSSFTAVIYPDAESSWLVAHNPETGTTTQGKTFEEALANLKEATELYLSFVSINKLSKRELVRNPSLASHLKPGQSFQLEDGKEPLVGSSQAPSTYSSANSRRVGPPV